MKFDKGADSEFVKKPFRHGVKTEIWMRFDFRFIFFLKFVNLQKQKWHQMYRICNWKLENDFKCFVAQNNHKMATSGDITLT